MDVTDGRDEQAPAPLPHNSSSSPTPSPPPKLPSSSPDPMATSSQQQQQQQQQAPAPPEAPAAAAAAPAATAASLSFARPSSPLSPNKKTSFDLGGSSSGAGAGPASLSPHPSLGRLSLGRISSRRLTAGGGGGVATPEETTMTMRMGRLLSVRKEEWSGDASLRRRNEEEEGKSKSIWRTLALAYASVGVIFGDITTSPLYTLEVTFHKLKAPPPRDEVLGAVSIIFWALTLLLLLKYTLIVLHADDQGNGGTFALFSILRRQGLAPPPGPVGAAAAPRAAASASASAPAAAAATKATSGSRFHQRAATAEDSSDAAVSAGISTFARGPEARRASMDFGGRRASAVFARSSTTASPSQEVPAASDQGGPAVAARSRAFLARAMSAPSGRRGGAPLPGGAGAAGGDVEAPSPPLPPAARPAISSSSSTRAKAAAEAERKSAGKDWRQRLIEREGVQTALKVMVVVGVGAILGDGVLTPSMSVVSAVEGLARPFPEAFAKGSPGVVGLAAGILAVLFLCQRAGTAGVAAIFSPVAVVWCFALAAIGIFNLVVVPRSVALSALSAVSPHHAVRFFARNGAEGWRSLGSLALCITGAEALFADLGHFNRKSITLATCALVYPSLILTYLGQAALLIHRPSTYSSPDGPPFWAAIPPHPVVYWPVFATTVAISVVASQALISAAFAIVKQGQGQGFMPRLQVIHTSKHHEGQIYIPAINWALAILCLSVVIAFRDSNVIGDAYGIAVLADMLLTTCFMTLVFLAVWKTHILIPVCFFAAFACVEGAFFSASLLKIPGKGWFAILMGAIWASVMAVYAAGSATKRRALVSPPLDRLLATGTTSWGSVTVGTLELGGGGGGGAPGKAASASAPAAPGGLRRDIAAGADPNHYSSSITVPLGNLRASGLGSSLSRPRRRGGAGAGAASAGGVGVVGGEGDTADGAHGPRTRAVARARGVAIFYSDALDATPPVLAHLIARVPCLFELNVFLTNRVVPVAEVPRAERLLARSQPVEGFFSVVARYGYMERIEQDECFAKGVVAFVLGRLGRKVCRAAGADDALRQALGLPREAFARALAADLGLAGGAATASSLASLLAPPPKWGSAATVASVADAFADAEAAEAADRERGRRDGEAAAAKLAAVEEGAPTATAAAAAAAPPPPSLPAPAPPPSHRQQHLPPPEDQGDRALRMLWRALFGEGSPLLLEHAATNGEQQQQQQPASPPPPSSSPSAVSSPAPAVLSQAELAERYPAVAAAVAECRVLEHAARQAAVVFLVAASKPHLAPVTGPLSFLRRLFVSAPYVFLVRNFQSDAAESFGIPRESALEVVLPYAV